MRLIDADALIETMKKVETEYEDAMTCPSWWTSYSVISEQPTVYDVEKVVEDVRKDCYSMGFDESQTEIIVNDIVKAGGVE
jgi:hypothetical protein